MDGELDKCYDPERSQRCWCTGQKFMETKGLNFPTGIMLDMEEEDDEVHKLPMRWVKLLIISH